MDVGDMSLFSGISATPAGRKELRISSVLTVTDLLERILRTEKENHVTVPVE